MPQQEQNKSTLGSYIFLGILAVVIYFAIKTSNDGGTRGSGDSVYYENGQQVYTPGGDW